MFSENNKTVVTFPSDIVDSGSNKDFFVRERLVYINDFSPDSLGLELRRDHLVVSVSVSLIVDVDGLELFLFLLLLLDFLGLGLLLLLLLVWLLFRNRLLSFNRLLFLNGGIDFERLNRVLSDWDLLGLWCWLHVSLC